MNLIDLAASKGVHLCAAESLTAGRLATAITQYPGASKVFLGSIVAYSDASKSRILSLAEALIEEQTAVSESVALSMSQNSRKLFSEANDLALDDVISVATTGVAGPEPVGSHPAGLVYISLSSRNGTYSKEFQFGGDREEVSGQATAAAISMLWEELERI
ncbi:MAG: hypothetical protein RLZ65_198 [Actinomycetota bacterium]|jgi:PncC family amidohydrolase